MALARNEMIDGPGGRLAVRAKGFDLPYGTAAILIHGANLSGQTGFDFSFPGGHDYSLMDHLLAKGIASATFGIRGYGASELAGDPLSVDTDAAIEDTRAVADWLAREYNVQRAHLLGWSWGGRIAARYTEQSPERVLRLVMFDPALGDAPNTTLPAPPPWQTNTAEWAMGRLEPELTDPEARLAFGQLVAQQEPRSPNGIRNEVIRGAVPAKPEAITRPTVVVYGAAIDVRHGAMPAPDFFDRLATDDKMFVVIPRGGHYLQVQRGRHRFYNLVTDWFSIAD
jgi:pimeloyl-ACP methyl ester carboxylesterase